MERVTGEQVRTAMTAAGIERVEHHDCSICGYKTAYLRAGPVLLFDPGCWCSSYQRDPEPRSWDSAADWINMQSSPEWREKIAASFGISEAA